MKNLFTLKRRSIVFFLIIVLFVLPIGTKAAPTSDTEPPNAIAFDFTTKVIDASASDQIITFTVHLTDDLSGVTDGMINGMGVSPSQVRFRSPSGNQFADVIIAPPGNLVSGNTLDGIYSSILVVPRYGESGTWQLQYLMLVDDVGNTRWLDRNQMIALGFSTDFNVTSIGDTQAPNVITFALTPNSVDVSILPQTITITARVTDDLSGVTDGTIGGKGAGPSQARFRSPSANQFADVVLAPPHNLVSGDTLDGIYSNTIVVPQFSESGTWQLQYLMLVDDVGNTRSLDRNQMIALGFSIDFNVTSASDTEPPNVLSFNFTPKTVDISSALQLITITTRLTDNLSGVTDGMIGSVGVSPSQARFRSPSGNQFADVIFAPPGNLVSGNTLDGIYLNTVSVAQCNETGQWQLQYLMLVDDVGNTRSLDRNQMNALGFPTDYNVTTGAVACSLLSAPVSTGSTTLPVISNAGFSIGGNVRINPGGLTQEDGRVVGFGSIILASGVKYAHSTNEIVLKLAPSNGYIIYLPMIRR